MLVEEHHRFDPLRFLAPVPDLPERYGELLVTRHRMPDNVVLVAEREGEVVGYAFGAKEGYDYMALRGPAGVIYDLLVDPGHRRQGIGSALMEAMLEALANSARPAPCCSPQRKILSLKRCSSARAFAGR